MKHFSLLHHVHLLVDVVAEWYTPQVDDHPSHLIPYANPTLVVTRSTLQDVVQYQ
jgi:hypothetical protein